MIDANGRSINYLRISVTDRCNLRCKYCMPREGVKLREHSDILTFDEIKRIVKVCGDLGIENIRLTGGEPLVRKDIVKLIEDIKHINTIKDISITTNGVMLADYIDDLKNAGLDRINISLDTLDKNKFKEITGFDVFDKVIEGIKLSIEKGFRSVKLNVVTMRENNISEVMDFVNLAEKDPIDVRFIELMPIGLGNLFTRISNDELKSIIQKNKTLIPYNNFNGFGPAKYFKTLTSKGSIGFISPISHEFCSKCNKVRLTSEGFLKLCLHWNSGINLRDKLRDGIDDTRLKELIYASIRDKPNKHEFDLVEDNKNEHEKYDLRSMFQIGG